MLQFRSLWYPCALALLLAVPASTAAQEASAGTRAVSLSQGRADVVNDGGLVVTFVASGDLMGVVTLRLEPAADGSFGGEWAFTVAHTDNTDPATSVEPEAHGDHGHEHEGGEPHEHPHRDYVRYVHRGALAGAVAGAQVQLNAEGAITAIAAPLVIEQGTSEFEGATGSGEATLTALTLTF